MPQPHTPVPPEDVDFPFVPSDTFADSLEKVLGDVKHLLIAEHLRFAGFARTEDVNRKIIFACDESSCDASTQTELLDSHVDACLDTELDSLDEEHRTLTEKASADTRYQVVRELKESLKTDEQIYEFAATHLIATLKRAGSNASMQAVSRTLREFRGWISGHLLETFESFMSGVILLNAVVIAISCDTRDWSGWIVFEIVFTFFYLVELTVKLRLMGCAGSVCGEDWKWTWFEIVLLVLAISEVSLEVLNYDDRFTGTATFRILRLLRLSKLARMGKVPFIQDLILMINGLIGGVRTWFFSVLLISIPLFILSILLRETLGREEEMQDGSEMFSSLPKAFFNIFRCAVAGDCSDENGRPIFVLVSARYGWAYGFIYTTTILLMSFGLFNVIVAIYVDNTLAVAKYDVAKKTENRLRDQNMFREKSLELAMLVYSYKMHQSVGSVKKQGIDFGELMQIELSPAEFFNVCQNPAFRKLLADLDVAEENQKDFFDTLDADHGGTLDIGEIVTGITKLRGDARKADIVGVALTARHISDSLAEFRAETLEILRENNRFLHGASPLLQNSQVHGRGSSKRMTR